MRMDFIEIGPVPCDEECEQLGPNYSAQRARHECEQFIAAITQKCGAPPEGARLAIKSNPHDFGSYLEVVVKYDTDNEAATEYAYKVESEAPQTWKFEHPIDGQPAYDFTPTYPQPGPKEPVQATKFYVGHVPEKCEMPDCKNRIRTEFIDGATMMGPWANMCPSCFDRFGCGLGAGKGQRYAMQPDGRFAKVGG